MPSHSIIQLLTDKFQAHKQSQFTGLVHISSSAKPQWSLYFHMGRLVWAHSRMHPVRRWHRQLLKHCKPWVESLTSEAGFDYSQIQYKPLASQVRKGELNRIHMAKAVEDYLSEILFDIVHQGILRQLQSRSGFTLTDVVKRFPSKLFMIVRSEQAWQQAQYDWKAWQQAELVKCSPNLAPHIGQAEELRKQTSEAVYQHLTSIIDGKKTFRDIAIELNQPLLPLTRRIVPYIRQGIMGLVRIDDLGSPNPQGAPQDQNSNVTQNSNVIRAGHAVPRQAAPVKAGATKTSASSTSKELGAQSLRKQPHSEPSPSELQSVESLQRNQLSQKGDRTLLQKNTSHKTTGKKTAGQRTQAASNAPLIIYIDDSPMDSKIMGDILQNSGFRFRNIQESTHALPLLIEHKPQLIFLDLVMPVANGYEICAQVRRVSLFKDIPIVIVTSNDTLSDRVRAKMVGASGFIAKPIQQDKVLKVVQKLLNDTPRKASKVASQSASKKGKGSHANPKAVTSSLKTSLNNANANLTAQKLEKPA